MSKQRIASGVMCIVAVGFLIYMLFFANVQPAENRIGLCYLRIEKNITDAIYGIVLPVTNSTDYESYYARLNYGELVSGSEGRIDDIMTFCDKLEASCRRNGTLQAMGCKWYDNWGCACSFTGE